MADYSSAQITLGGCVPRRLVPRLCAAIRAARLSWDWGEPPLAPQSAEELLQAREQRDGDWWLQLYHDQARYGEFPDLEALLVKHEIPFDRQSEGHFDYPPARVAYRPELGLRRWLTTPQGEPLAPAEPVWELLAALQATRAQSPPPRNSRAASSASARSSRARSARRARGAGPLHAALTRLQELLPNPPPPLPRFEIGCSLGLRNRAA